MSSRKKKTRKISPRAKKAIKVQTSSKHKVRNSVILIFVGAFLLWLTITVAFAGLFSQTMNKISEATLHATAQMGFKINQVNVIGRNRTDADLLRALLNVEHGDPIFTFNANDATGLIEKITWVKRADVRRHLPDTIEINLEERTPVALWQNKQGLAVIDKDGNVLTRNNLEEYASLPLLVGEKAPEHAYDIIAMLNAEPKITNYLDSIIRIGDRRWDLKLSNKTRVKLPETDPELALSLLLKMHKRDNILEKNWDYIDLRLNDQVIMKPISNTASNNN